MSTESQIALAAAEAAAASATTAGTAAQFASGTIADLDAIRDEVHEAIDSGLGLNVTWTTATAAQIANAQGYWVVVSETQPAETEMYGVPVVWIDQTTALTPVPVNPSSPTWNDTTGQFTVPSGVVGVDYVWTSGGGGVGTTVTQGSTQSTSGTFPRTVVVAPVAKPGYVLFGATAFTHSFPDPAAVTVLTSDGFSGAAGAFSGRSTDIADGGTAKAYHNGSGLTTPLEWMVLNGSGAADMRAAAGGAGAPTLGPDWGGASTRNMRAEWDITAAALNGASVNDTPLNIAIVRAGTIPAPNGAPQIGFSIGAQRIRAQAMNLASGNTDIVWETGGPLPTTGTQIPTGHYTLQVYLNTATFIMPDGSGGFVTRTVNLDPATFKAATSPWTDYNVRFQMYGFSTPQTLTLDNLKISRLGF